MHNNKTFWLHAAAILTVFVWGTTFVSTKVLIGEGLSPVEIMIYRFVLAYLGIWLVCVRANGGARSLLARNLKDELMFVGSGLSAGSLYFVFENTALRFTMASNVSLIICTAPIFTAFLNRLFYKGEGIHPHLLLGSLVAFIGVGLVVFNGSHILEVNPLGDVLTLLAALSWAFYGVLLRKLNGRYSTLLITRKVFFYGIVTMLVIVPFYPNALNINLLLRPVVMGNILFLGIVASLACYIMWNMAVKELGVVKVSNYIYLTPPVTLLTSTIFINEHITFIALAGMMLILSGVYWADRANARKA